VKPLVTIASRILLIASWGWIASSIGVAHAQTNDDIRIIELRGTVEILPQGAVNWLHLNLADALHPHDRVRTGTNSSVSLICSGQTPLRFSELTEMEILPPEKADDDHSLRLIQGLLYFFHRDKPGRIRIITSGAFAGVEGTEFTMQVGQTNGVEQTTLSVIDGKVRFSNNAGTLLLTNGDQAVAEPGQAPRRTAGFIANNLLQWCFYYPGVLDLNDLPPSLRSDSLFAESFTAYREGDLLAALAKYPDARPDSSDAGQLYHAALLLSVGNVEEAETILDNIAATNPSEINQRLANALRTLIAAVKREPRPSADNYQLPTELLAASYYEQSLAGANSLANALQLAQRAVTNSPNFGFGWERVAELEFSFGRTERALAALNKALIISPRNAQALSLKGFLLAAQNQPRAAIEQFDRALAVDAVLGNAWLGRGLCRIRLGEAKAGREDLLIAAAMEPQRATLRSYLGKAFGDAGDTPHATHELQLAKQLDPNDPTAWLYSALMDEQNNQINDAIRDLEKSQALNDNRSVYRSGLLLDQDRAVGSANLARIYDEAGLDDVAVREASRAVSADYENYSAHLFLANSYQQLRDSSPFDLRYETPAYSEYLIASLLGPADGRLLAQPVSQQEYTRLFDRDSFGFSSSTEYLSRGAVNQYAAQYGTLKNTSYALESDYNYDPGQTPNGGQTSSQLDFKMKQMLTPNDGVFFEVVDFHQTGGDLSQHYYPTNADMAFNTQEKQEPSVLLGLDHKWNEDQHTLLLASFFNDTLSLVDGNGSSYLLGNVVSGGPPFKFAPVSLTEHFENRLTIESFEVQHLATISQFQTIAGMRVQVGNYRLANDQSWLLHNQQNNDPLDTFLFPDPPANLTNQSFRAHSLRLSPYLYEYWHLTPQFCLIGGLSYDYQSLPQNALFAPLSPGEKIQNQVSPKVAMVWQPTARSVVRAAYSQSLGGANLDQSLRLEPTQLAGFTQAYRDIMPDSLAGGIGGARFETADISLEHRFDPGTYVALSAELLHSTADQTVGAFSQAFSGEGSAVELAQKFSFQERSIDFSIHQLLGDYFSIGARYRLTDAHLTTTFPLVDSTLGTTRLNVGGLLHLVSLDGIFQMPCGLFASVEGQWWEQELRDDLSPMPGDHFWQANARLGYRSPRRHIEISAGLMNITGQNYNLSPINLYPDLPRQCSFVTEIKLNF